jgi:hypothetical protein
MKILSPYAAGLCLFLLFSGRAAAQSSSDPVLPLDSVLLKPLKGPNISFSSLTQKDSVVLICFWSSGSEASINALNAVNTQFENWQRLAKFKMMAVCVDEGKDVGRVRPMVNAYGWIFDVYIDINGDLRKTLKSVNLPQSIILYKGQVLYQQSGFGTGSENYLIKRIEALANAKSKN